MNAQLTVLLVVLPLICAPITAMLRGKGVAWFLSFVLSLVCFGLSLWLLADVVGGKVLHYELGGWRPPWGIEYQIDALNALIAVIVTAMASLAMLYAPKSVEKEISEHVVPLFYATFQLCLLGLLGIALTGDIFNLFVFLEISSLSSYALIAMGKHRKALTAAFYYLVLGTMGATFFLIGVGMLYAASGSLNMADILARFGNYQEQQLVTTSLAFILVGVALKAAIFPLHSWLPSSYSQAPSVVSVFLAASATKVAIYVLIRCLFNVYPMEYWTTIVLPDLLVGLGCVGILYGSFRAFGQLDMKRLLAYSSVAQIGYMVVGIGLVNQTAMTASLLHLFNHAVMKAALFMVAGILLYRANTTYLKDLHGLGRDDPRTLLALAIAGLSLIGMPGTVGFISKWYLISGALEVGRWYVVLVVLAGSVLAILYVWKMIESLYFARAEKPHVHHVTPGTEDVAHTPASMSIALWLAVIACIYFGLDTDFSRHAAETAVKALFSQQGGL
ncbi:monovalent cation/H+ antiporter subunit D family protein [Alteromonas flava]|uniref:monovalent cation/H+ antiporter subunit D family protein n=1 Tax=Alteromonas flava TaxID=2048003 RepID=UPI000C285B0E|nr:monovalent cation/H+ antiporter subunit D family protein [Alteromonas flava]